jgi:L-lactate dehydrogenase
MMKRARKERHTVKIAILGSGRVGSALAQAVVLKQLCDHLVIAGRTVSKALGDALDLRHSLSFSPRSMAIEAGAVGDVRDCDIVVVTASVAAGPGFTSRLQLAAGNSELFRELIPALADRNPDALLVIVTNPVDVMTHLATRLSGFPPQRVMGVGTLVDSARFRTLLSQAVNIHPDDLRAYVLGEHGPHQFPVLSHAQAGGEPIRATPAHLQLFEQVIEAGFEVYRLKGYTNYAIASATCLVLEAIVFDQRRTMPLATCFEDWLGIRDNCFSIPVVVGRLGIVRHLHPKLSKAEYQKLQEVAVAVRETIDSLKGPE